MAVLEEEERMIGSAEVWIVMRDKMALQTFFHQIYNISTRGSYMIDYLFDEWTGEFAADRTGLDNVDLDEGTMIWLEYMEVDEGYRGKGVMRKMLFEAQRKIEELVDSCFVVSYSTMSIADHDVYRVDDGGDDDEFSQLFRSLGFQRVRKTPYYIRGTELDDDDEAPSPTTNGGPPDNCVRTLFTT